MLPKFKISEYSYYQNRLRRVLSWLELSKSGLCSYCLNNPERMGHNILHFVRDDYNKELGATLIDAKNDAEAIETFLSEYKDSPETLRSYTYATEPYFGLTINVNAK